ncbi:STAS domain-containing protein [Streptomyces sp. YS-3]|uniref:STAS domain-containing protein n=1 Tax=Streptomyces sp. YS-3 TaxID=3381352 RepID=UPI003862C957
MVKPSGPRTFRCLLPGPAAVIDVCAVPDRRAVRVVQTTVSGSTPRTALVRVFGDVDIETAPVLDYALLCAGAQRVVVDLSGCGFGDCALLTVLLRARRRSELVLVGPLPTRIQRLFDLTGTTSAFTILTDVSEVPLVQPPLVHPPLVHPPYGPA